MRQILVTAVFLGMLTLALSGCKSQHDKMAERVKDTLKVGLKAWGYEGADVEPVVELARQGDDDWVGTATCGEALYDLRVYKKKNDHQLTLEWRMREPKRLSAVGSLPLSPSR
jgi:hypothetical protein